MITMKEWMELVNYRITEGSDYCWECYGSNAYALDSWNGDHDGHSFCIIFDSKDQTVYEVQAHDFLNQRAYRMVNEDFRKKMRKEAKRRDVNKDEAWDDVDYVDLEVDDDFIQKCLAIAAGEDYSTDVSIPIDLPDELLMFAFKQAHEKNMTFNDFINQVLRDFIDKVDKGVYNKEDVQRWAVESGQRPFEKDKDED
jgi:predicted DNA binding CopG/RHH family protein